MIPLLTELTTLIIPLNTELTIPCIADPIELNILKKPLTAVLTAFETALDITLVIEFHTAEINPAMPLIIDAVEDRNNDQFSVTIATITPTIPDIILKTLDQIVCAIEARRPNRRCNTDYSCPTVVMIVTNVEIIVVIVVTIKVQIF